MVRWREPLLDRFLSRFMLNHILGGRDAVKLAGLTGVDRIMKPRKSGPS